MNNWAYSNNQNNYPYPYPNQFVNAYPNSPKIGADEFENPSKTSSKKKIILIFAVIVIMVLVAILIAILGETSYLVDKQQECPDCECNATTSAPETLSIADLSYYEKTTVSNTIESLTKHSEYLRKCSFLCLDRFYECPSAPDPTTCIRKTLVARDCQNFQKCINECTDICDADHRSSTISYSLYQCINQFNENLICPRDGGQSNNFGENNSGGNNSGERDRNKERNDANDANKKDRYAPS